MDEADKIVTKVIFVQHIPMMNIDVGWCALDYNRACRGLLLCTMSTLQTTLAQWWECSRNNKDWTLVAHVFDSDDDFRNVDHVHNNCVRPRHFQECV